MGFEAKKKHAIAIMESKKMWRSNYAPPLLHLAWKAGLKIPPLPFASFWQITLLMGGWFGPAWGICMWFFTWKDTGIQPGTAFVSSVVAGIYLVFLWLRIIGGERSLTTCQTGIALDEKSNIFRACYLENSEARICCSG